LEFIVKVQVPVPEQAPDQPANVDAEFGVTVSVTTLPAAKLRPLVPQLRLEAAELTQITPLPVNEVAVVRANCCVALKLAVIISSAFTVKLQVSLIPRQSPKELPQLANVD
jgi:hypothetical protein